MSLMDVFVKVGADTSELESGLNKSKGLVSGLASGIGGAMKVAGAAIAGATTAVGGFAAASVKVGATFDSSMSQVAATMGVTVDEIGELRDFAQQMGATTAFSATQAADALNYMALAGYTADEAMEALPNVLNLAAAGSMDLATASDMVTDAQSALGLTMEESTKLVDMMAKTSSKSNTSVQQLGDAILTVGGTANTLAGGTNELTTALGLLADNGIKGAEGGTKLRNVILSLSAPTDNAAAMLKDLGVETVDAAGNLRPLEEIMGDLGDSLDGLGTAERAEIINTVFNKQDIAAVNALLNTSADRWDELSEAIDDSQGAAEKMSKTQLDNLNGDITLFKSALEGAQILISDALTPSLRDFVNFGTSGITKISEGFKSGGLSGAMEAFGGVLSDGIGMITKMLPDAIKAGMELLGAVGQGILDNTPQIVDAAVHIALMLVNGLISAAPKLGEGVIQLIKSLRDSFKDNAPVMQALGKTLLNVLKEGVTTGIPELIGEIFTDIVNYFSEHATEMANTGASIIQSIVNGIAENLPALMEGLADIIVSIATALTDPGTLTPLLDGALNIILALADGLLKAIPKLIEAIPTIIENLVRGLVDNLPKIIDAGIKLIGGLQKALIENLPLILEAGIKILFALVQGIIESIPSLLVAGFKLITELFGTLITSLPKMLEGGVRLVGALVSGIINTIGSVVKAGISLITQFISAIRDRFTSITSAGKEAVDTFKNGIMGKINEAKQWGKDLIDNFIGGIKAKWDALKSTVSDIAGSVKDLLGFSEPKEGPLSNFHTYAPDMMMLFAKGIKDNEAMLRGVVAEAFDFTDLIGNEPQVAYAGAGAYGGDYNQTINIYSPTALTPSEVARQTRNATRDMVLELRGKR